MESACARSITALAGGLWGTHAAQLGGPPIAFMGRSFLAYSPQRHYFQVRNAILLYRQSWVPKRWALASSWRLLLKIGFNCIAGNSRWQHFKMTVRGLWHGCGGRVGPL